MRSGEALLQGLISLHKGLARGNMLIQRDEADKHKRARMFVCQLPNEISDKHVLLLDPMLATGGSAKLAIQTLVDKGVKKENRYICGPQLIRALTNKARTAAESWELAAEVDAVSEDGKCTGVIAMNDFLRTSLNSRDDVL